MLDPVIEHHLRTTVEYVTEDEFWAAAANLHYQRFTKILPTDTLVEIKTHRIAGAGYEDFGESGGGIRYEDTVLASQEFRNHYAKAGYKIAEGEFNDFNGKGIALASDWSRDVGYAGAYWPQRKAIAVLRNGTSLSMVTDNGNVVKLVCYDGKALFANDHPYNYKRPSLGSFCNLAINTNTDAAHPKFLPLGGPFKQNATTGVWEYDSTAGGADSVSNEDALKNLFLMISHVRSLKMPDGITPRYLDPTCIIHGPKLAQKVLTITNAQFIAASSGGTDEIKGIVTKLGLSEPVKLDELIGTGTTEDWDWYLTCEPQIARSKFGLICYGNLEAFNVHVYAATAGSQGVNLQLAESNFVHLISQGRNFVGPGLPQYGFKSQGPRS